jgi:hypothetical protein
MGLRGFLQKMGLVLSDTEVYVRGLFLRYQGAPGEMTDTGALTAADLLSGIILGTPTAAANYTLPTGVALDDALTSFMTLYASFDFSIINLSVTDDDIITLIASAGISIVGSPYINANEFEQSYYRNTGVFRCRYTAENTFILYRIG